MLLPASHVTYTVYNFTDLINNSVCLSVCLYTLIFSYSQFNTDSVAVYSFTSYRLHTSQFHEHRDHWSSLYDLCGISFTWKRFHSPLMNFIESRSQEQSIV